MKSLKNSLLAALLVSFVGLFAVGCGNSNNDDFVITNNNQNTTTGALTFQFARAQTTTVPTNTTDLLFEFRNAENSVVYTETVPFSTTVTINNVPATATQVEITALQNGFPVATVTDDVTVTIAQTTQVDLTNAGNTNITFDELTVTPATNNLSGGDSQNLSVVATFSDTSSVPVPNSAVTFTSNNTALANVSASGVISTLPATGGNTTVDASWTFNSVERTDSVSVTVGSVFFVGEGESVFPASIPQGEEFDLETRIAFSNGTVQDIDSEATYTFVPEVAGVSIESSDNIAVGESVTPGTTFQLRASFTDPATNITHSVLSPVITVTAAQQPMNS